MTRPVRNGFLLVAVIALFTAFSIAPSVEASGRKNVHWDETWVYVGLEVSVGCVVLDDNPLGYVEHWRYYGGRSWEESSYGSWNGRPVPVYGWFDGYRSPDQNSARDYIGPAEITKTKEYYKCWSA